MCYLRVYIKRWFADYMLDDIIGLSKRLREEVDLRRLRRYEDYVYIDLTKSKG